MSDQDQGSLNSASGGGVAGDHASDTLAPFVVAPTTTTEANAVRLRLIPIACWRVDEIRFEFDSSFVRPEVQAELDQLAGLVQQHPGCPLSVFGHADPVGSDDYNKSLSGRRATAVYAILIAGTDPDSAAALWQAIAAQENWGSQASAVMQSATGLPAGTSQSALIQAYLKFLGQKLQLAKTDFLGKGADAGGKSDYQGCSEFNPLLLFSTSEQSRYSQSGDNTRRNAANAPNRRVMVLMFRQGSQVDPSKWPCPRATEGKAGCLLRFWSEGDTRRSTQLPDQRRLFDKTHDTFACRFYQRLATTSPCEQTAAVFRFGFADVLCQKDKDNMRLQIENEDGTTVKTFTIDEGAVTGTMRVFTFAKAVSGVAYKAYLTRQKRKLLLIQDAVITEIMDPEASDKSVTHVHEKQAPPEVPADNSDPGT